jgi:hypothetical protein
LAIAPPGQKGTVSPRRYDMRALWTLCGWGSAAAPDGKPAVLVEVLYAANAGCRASGSDHAVDLGGAFSREALTARWTEVNGKFGSQLHGLRPLIGLESRFGYAPYRLVVGPLADEAAARKLCTRLSAKINCRPTRFTGDRLARP